MVVVLPGADAERLVAAADALYAAKEDGRNAVRAAEPVDSAPVRG